MGNFWIVPLLHTVSDTVEKLMNWWSHTSTPTTLLDGPIFCHFQGEYYISSTRRRNTVTGNWTLDVRYKVNCRPPRPPPQDSHTDCRWQCIAYIYYKQAICPLHHKVHFLWPWLRTSWGSKNRSFVCTKLNSSGSKNAHSGQHDRKRVVMRDRFSADQRC